MECRTHLFIYTILSVLVNSQILSIQYTPIEVGDLADCALVLPNSAHYLSDLLRSDYGAPVNCITYDAINQAYADARRRIDIPVVEDNWKPEEVAAVGQLLLDVSQQLTKEFDLTIEDVEIGLPQIDTAKTAIGDICPVFLSSISCRAGKYRRHDGLCNNVHHPTWGAADTPFTRLLPPQFADHVSAPRISVTGRELPSARVVSRTVHTDEGYHDHAGTMMTVAWGQFMDHDFTLMGTPLDSRNRNEPEECCNRPDHVKNPYCMEIMIPEDDYFYGKFDIKCQDFVRAFPGVQPNCKLGSRNPFNTLTGVIDGNTVYGVTDDLARQLRAGSNGLLKMNPAFASLGLKELLPMKTDVPDEGCTRTNSSQFCFQAGEIRVNEQLVLTCIHTLMAREHNRVAVELAALNPHWDDEILYQEARRITAAEIQHITYNEFLPLILGKAVMEKYGLLLTSEGYWDGYNPEINPNIMDAFSAAAYRFGHSLLPSSIERWSKLHKFIASKRLSEVIRRPYDLYRAGVIDEYFMGLLNQVAQAMDDSVTQEVTNNLFKKAGNRFGLDLVSFNIQRGRDFGLPGYMYFRKHCGLSTADTFTDMFDMMPNSTIHRYMSIFEHPWDIDLWSGGVAENPLAGSMVGPTFACIIATQMSLLRRGDRFWYELPNQPSSFTPEQLQEIRKIKLSRVLCDNSDLLDTVQIYSMVLPDHDINPRVPCRSSVLPKLDLSHWADSPVSSFDDVTSYVTNVLTKTPSSNASSPPLYAYHVKTVAIIGGPSPPVNVNDLLEPTDYQPPYREDSDYDHRVKRHVNLTEQPIVVDKDITKRSYHPRLRSPRPAMTQAIMRGNRDNLRSRSTHDDPDIDNFFRKNVPIYDGIPSARGTGYSGFPSSLRRYPRPYGAQKDEEDQDEKEQPMSVEEVDAEHDGQYEEVPMMINEHGKQKLMPGHDDDDDGGYRSKYSFPKYRHGEYPKYQSDYSSPFNGDHAPHYNSEYSPRFPSETSRFPSADSVRYLNDHGSGFSSDVLPTPSSFAHPRKPVSGHPYKFDHLRVPDSDAFSTPPKYGTSHQYNSLADNHPRYYKHFAPSIRTQFASATDDELQYPNSDYPDEPSPPRFKSHDFSRRPHDAGSYRSAHVPQTLEEYHRLHHTFRKTPPRFGRFNARKKVPDEDKDEDEKEEKEDEDDKDEKDEESPGSKSFVSMNFKNFGLNDDGISIKHHLPRPSFAHKPRFSEPDDSPYHAAFPNVAPSESAPDTPHFQDPQLIKSFVNSMFHKDTAPANDYVGSARRPEASPYNANFGERLKISKPAQNILWHRKSPRPRERASNFRSMYDREHAVREDDVKPFGSSKTLDFDFKPAKRDIDLGNATVHHAVNGSAEEPPVAEEADESEPSAAASAADQPDDQSHEHYWSESYSEPNPSDENVSS